MTALPTPWVPTPGSRVPPPLPRAYPGGATPWGPLAARPARVGAFLVDWGLALPGAAAARYARARIEQGHVTPGMVLLLLLGTALCWGIVLANRVVWSGATGLSVGRRLCGIRLVSERTGEPLGAPACLAREIAHLVDGVAFLGYLAALVDPRRRTVADRVVGSVVVRAR